MMMECESRDSAGLGDAGSRDTTLVACLFRFFVQSGIYSSPYACTVSNTYLGGSGGEMVKVGRAREAGFKSLC